MHQPKSKPGKDEISNPHDAFFKSLLGRRALAAQFLRHYLPKAVTADFDLRTLERVRDSFVSEDLRHYFSDLIFRVNAKYVSSAAVGMKPEQMKKKLAAAFPGRKGVDMQTVAEIWRQEGLQMGLEQGGQMAAAEMALQLLEHRFGQVSERAKRQILRLPLAVLKELGGVLLDFATPADLAAWLREPKAGISSRGVSV